MRKIILFCANGMSTSLLVSKMEQYANSIQYDCEIAAYPVSEAKNFNGEADICLLGPQVRFNLKNVQAQVSCPVEAIDMRSYGTMDGKAVIEQVKKALGD